LRATRRNPLFEDSPKLSSALTAENYICGRISLQIKSYELLAKFLQRDALVAIFGGARGFFGG
jgi:hypothetical protein